MTPEDRARIAQELGFDEVPKPRGDVPEDAPAIPRDFRPSFYKALMLVDQIETWAFERFVPDLCVIDLGIDTRVFKSDWSQLVYVRTDVPPPSNVRIHRLTGILPATHDAAMSRPNFYQYLGVTLAYHYLKMGAVAMGPPLIFSTLAPPHQKQWWNRIVPFLGAIVKFDRTPPDGRRSLDMVGDTGVLMLPKVAMTHALDT